MCGICGIAGFEDKRLLKDMCNIIQHRGPNDSGIFLDKNIGLGNRRLSIIDIAGGHQPIHNENNSIWITYNGEIYNFLKLRQVLENKGHKFYTSSDTEVIVHLYEEFGKKFVNKLRGMFAIAIWDSKKQQLLLVRDRLGKKPLYYTSFDGKFLFASEIKSILQFEELPRELDYKALDYFITFRYVPGPHTMFKGIKKLQPGHILVYHKGEVKIEKYWDMKFKDSDKKPEEYYVKHLFELLKEAVKVRLISEVPLGTYLSGGPDSSSVVAIMSELMEEPVKTFTVGFGDKRFDELKYAKIVADKFGTDHHEFIVDPKRVELLPKVIWYFDEPIADPAAIPTYLISELAKKYATVILTGEGGDEMFAGYEQYKIILKTRQYNWLLTRKTMSEIISRFIKIVPKRLLNSIFPYTSALGDKGLERAARYVRSFGNIAKAYLEIVSIFDQIEKTKLYSDSFNEQGKNFDVTKDISIFFQNTTKENLLNSLLLLETKIQLPDNLLMKVDKMTMAYSIEARTPLLDEVIVEFSSTIPPALKVKGMSGKYILRKTMAKIIPRTIIERKKQRFFVPIDLWFEEDFGDLVKQIFSEKNVKKRGYFKYSHISHIIENFQKSKLFYSRQLWNLLTFELWHRIFIDNTNLKKPKLSLDQIV